MRSSNYIGPTHRRTLGAHQRDRVCVLQPGQARISVARGDRDPVLGDVTHLRENAPPL
ncbi:MAG TPA: hypothetical protein VFN67_10630 [Polyangiales bacterium]|nr:hypothetical protein [Polyangiales bacterium]